MIGKKLMSIVLSSLLFFGIPYLSYADINTDLDSYFNKLGFSSNTTSPNAYHGQQAGYYTGGSISMRNQVRDVQVMQVNLPSYRSGCGGIDVYAGSLSLINEKEILNMLQNVLNSAGAYAFTLALETATPEIANVMKYYNDYLSAINQSNLNSCEMAESLVGGAWPKVRGAHERVCEDIGTSNNTFSSWAQARQGCGFNGESDKVINDGKKDSRYKDLIVDDGNIVWQAIQKRAFLQSDKELAELFMSFSGTVILYKDNNSMQHQSYPALIENNDLVTALLKGGKATIYRCDTTEADGCLHPKADKEITISEEKAFKSRVSKLLRSMAQKIVDDAALSDEEQGLLKATSVPVYKILTVQAAYFKTVPDVEQLADVVAADVLSKYLHESLSIIKASIAILPYPDAILAEIQPSIEKEMDELSQQRKNAYAELSVTIQLIEQSQSIERMLAGDLSSEFASTLSWAKGLR